MRWRNSCGRISLTRWNAPFVPPFVWQSKARNCTARLLRAPVDRLIELLLRKWRQQQLQSLRTPSCTGLVRSITTPLAGWSLRSYRSSSRSICRFMIAGSAATMQKLETE